MREGGLVGLYRSMSEIRSGGLVFISVGMERD